MLTLGPGVGDVSEAFDRFWNAPASIPVAALLGRSGDAADLDALRAELAAFVEAQRDSPYVMHAQTELAERLVAGTDGVFWGKAHLLYDDPAKIEPRARGSPRATCCRSSPLSARRRDNELLIVSPYFVPGEAGVAWLRGLVERGVRVTVLTNSLAATDVGAVHAGYQRYREALLEAGVRLYELKPDAIRIRARQGARRAASAARAPPCMPRPSSSTGVPCSSARSTSIRVRCDSIPRSASCARARAWPRNCRPSSNRTSTRSLGGSSASSTPREARASRGWRPAARASGSVLEEPEVSAWRKLSVWLLGLLPIESQL